MTTLLTGGTGYLGAAVLERCLETGVRNLRCFVRPGASRQRLLALRARYGRAAIELVEGNLARRRDADRAVAGVERVVHLAAGMRGAPADMFINTVVASQHLFDAVARSAVRRLVVVSSLSVYGLSDVAPTRLIAEDTPLDQHPDRRDTYTHTKIWQERLLGVLAGRSSLSCVVLRPGPLYGRGGSALPSRIGLQLPGLLLQLCGSARLPLSYLDNCAEAVRFAAFDDAVPPGAYNVVDDDLPTVSAYLDRYRNEVQRIRVLRLPFAGTLMLARWNEHFHVRSRGQIPRVLTPYRARNIWRGHVYDNARLKHAGWQQRIPTEAALNAAFGAWRDRLGVRGPALVAATR